MLSKTNGIVLRSIKYGESSLVTTIFTSVYGLQTYIVQGVRGSKPGKNRAGFFQPGQMLELVVYQQPQKNMQRIREFQAAYLYNGMQENVVKNSIVLFSVEFLLRLLPEHAPLPVLYDMVSTYFVSLDKIPADRVANFPLYFIIQCSRLFGYELKGSYTQQTPYLDMQEGGFTMDAPSATYAVNNEDTVALDQLLKAAAYEELDRVHMNADMRMRLIDWYIMFLQQHTQHMGNIRSLSILRMILH
jgi:DNA repair protein RecO (recombination protein O)